MMHDDDLGVTIPATIALFSTGGQRKLTQMIEPVSAEPSDGGRFAGDGHNRIVVVVGHIEPIGRTSPTERRQEGLLMLLVLDLFTER